MENKIAKTIVDYAPAGFRGEEVHAILTAKGITHLYHANTVATSELFLKEKALLSRGYVERNGLFQTAQYTDQLDKDYNIWNYVFLDGAHLGNGFGVNKYGPVLFVMDVNVLLSEEVGSVRITRLNPVHWRGEPQRTESLYCTSLEEFERNYAPTTGSLRSRTYQSCNMMLMLEGVEGKLNLAPFFRRLEVDNPDGTLKNGQQIIDYALERLRPLRKELGASGTIVHNRAAYYQDLRKRSPRQFKELFGFSDIQ